MPTSTFAGHPLHPMLIVAPAALLPFGFILDAMHRATGEDSYADAAYYNLTGGLPRDAHMAHALTRAERAMPAGGPLLH